MEEIFYTSMVDVIDELVSSYEEGIEELDDYSSTLLACKGDICEILPFLLDEAYEIGNIHISEEDSETDLYSVNIQNDIITIQPYSEDIFSDTCIVMEYVNSRIIRSLDCSDVRAAYFDEEFADECDECENCGCMCHPDYYEEECEEENIVELLANLMHLI